MSRRCARPGCGQPADTTLSYDYARRLVWLDDLHFDNSPAITISADVTPTEPSRRRAGNFGPPFGAQAAVTLKFAS